MKRRRIINFNIDDILEQVVDPFGNHANLKEALAHDPTYLRRQHNGMLTVVRKNQEQFAHRLAKGISNIGIPRVPQKPVISTTTALARTGGKLALLAGIGVGAYYLTKKFKESRRGKK